MAVKFKAYVPSYTLAVTFVINRNIHYTYSVLFCECWHIPNDVVAPSEKNPGCWDGGPAQNTRLIMSKMALGSVEPVNLATRACHESLACSSICEARNTQSTLFTVKLPAP